MTTENDALNLFNFAMPKFEETSDSATIVKWLKQPGQAIAKGEVLVEVETEKFTHPIECPIAATVVELLIAEGEEVDVGVLLATLQPTKVGD